LFTYWLSSFRRATARQSRSKNRALPKEGEYLYQFEESNEPYYKAKKKTSVAPVERDEDGRRYTSNW